jgi:hypothetical protein
MVLKKINNSPSQGTIRVGKNLKIYEFKRDKWIVVKKDMSNALFVVRLYKAGKRFAILIDKKDSRFLKGQLSMDKKILGARINILPNGKKLDGAFSLFSPGLTLHDELSNMHWDVIYLNPNGKFAYHYTLDKKGVSIRRKYRHVKEFEKKYPVLEKGALGALKKDEGFMAVPFYTLLKTHMRVGNEIYYKAHGHKGLTTLKKKDIKIIGRRVQFQFLGKDGVPQKIVKKFPLSYINRLKKILSECKRNDFVFKNLRGRLLSERDFKKEFRKYIDGDFYPHIVRSYFATKETEDFLRAHKNPGKEEVREFLGGVAEELGHKKISKKTGEWVDSYSVTMGHYIDPKLVVKLRKYM